MWESGGLIMSSVAYLPCPRLEFELTAKRRIETHSCSFERKKSDFFIVVEAEQTGLSFSQMRFENRSNMNISKLSKGTMNSHYLSNNTQNRLSNA